MKYPVNLRNSINTASLDQDIKPVGDGEHRVMTGIERDGGLTNLYREDVENPFFNGDWHKSIITDSGRVLDLIPNFAELYVKLDGVQIGTLLAESVLERGAFAGCLDVCTSSTGTILVIKADFALAPGVITYSEYTPGGALLNTRSVITGFGFDRAGIVRSRTLAYANPVELVLAASLGGGVQAFRHFVEAGALTAFTMAGASMLIPPYVYKYENAGSYLVSSPYEGVAAVGNIAAGAALAIFTARYFVLQVSGGFSRHIVTKTPALSAGNLLEAVGIIGHNTFLAAFTAAPAWQTPADVATALSTASRCTYGGVEGTITFGGNLKHLAAPQFNTAAGFAGFYDYQVSGDSRTFDYYGQLANNRGAGDGVGPGLRLICVNGVPSHLSYTQGENLMGTVISPVGEFDDTYTPSVWGTNAEYDKVVVYKYGGTFYAIKLGWTTAPTVGKIARDVYRINCLDVQAVVDCSDGTLWMAGSDWNGRFGYVNASGATDVLRAFTLDAKWSGQVDPGEKPRLATGTFFPIGFYISNRGDGRIAEYSASEYVRSWIESTAAGVGEYFADPALQGTLYLSDQTLPVAAGATYDDRAAVILAETFIREIDADKYLLGNRLSARYDTFELFGNLYAYNEGTVWLVPLSSTGFVQTLQAIARGQALQLIATAPTMVYFLSTWDNSLYSFDGGRSLVKGPRFSQAPLIIKGEWSVAENSLTLDAVGAFYFVRDGIVSSVAKNADQALGVMLWSADDGVHIVAPSYRYKYNYNAVGTVQPFAWRSAFYGLDANRAAKLKEIIYTIFSPTKATITVQLALDGFDVDDYEQETQELTIYPDDYNAAGYKRLRLIPAKQYGLAFSPGLACSSKMVLLDVAVELEESAEILVGSKSTV